MKKLIFLTILFVLGLALVPRQSEALTVSPAKILLSADPGERIETKMRVRNDSERILTFYPVFERYSTRGGEEPIFTPEKFGLVTWMRTEPSELTLGFKETGEVAVIIDLPEDAEPGGHYAAVFWSTAPPEGKGTGVGIVTRVGALVLLEISGEVKVSGEIINFQTQKKVLNRLPANFTYALQNKGTVHLGPVGQITLKNLFGKIVAVLDANPGKYHVLPGDSRTFTAVNWEPKGGMPKIEGKGFLNDVKRELKGFSFGYYRAYLSVEYGKEEMQTAQASFGFWVIPWRVLTLSILILALVTLIIVKGIHRYNQWVIDKVEERITAKAKRKIKI